MELFQNGILLELFQNGILLELYLNGILLELYQNGIVVCFTRVEQSTCQLEYLVLEFG